MPLNPTKDLQSNETGRESSPIDGFGRILGECSLRLKREHFRRLMGGTIMILAMMAYLLAVVALWSEYIVMLTPWWHVVATSVLLLVLARSLGRPVDENEVVRRMDRYAGLEDHARATYDFLNAKSGFWRDRLINQTLEGLLAVNWSSTWIIRWPRYTSWAVFIFIFCSFIQFKLFDAALIASQSTGEQPRKLVRAGQINSVFSDWKEETRSPEMEPFEELSELIKPLEKQLLDPDSSERDHLLELNRVEEALVARQKALESESLENFKEDLADAIESVNGLDRSAAALRQRDFKKAFEEMEKAGAQLRDKKDKSQMAKNPEDTARKMTATVQKLQNAGKKKLSDGLGQMSESIKQGNGKKMASGLEKLKEETQRESMRQSEMAGLGKKLSDIDQMKKNIGQGLGAMAGMEKGHGDKPGGLKAGEGTGKDPFGDPVDLHAELDDMRLSGTMGEGDSVKETVRSLEGKGSTLSSRGTVDFSAYEKLSDRAVRDESIPLSHRESIRRYFQAIRPEDDK